MSLWRHLTRGVRAVSQRSTTDGEIADELRHFHEQTVAEHVAHGASPAEAERAARVELGSLTAAREQVRSYGWENVVESLYVDVRYALRRLRRTPGFSIVSIATLGLGIGASTAIFSAVNPVLIESLPYPKSGQLVWMQDQ